MCHVSEISTAVPFATELLPGKWFEERLTLPLPIKLELPYLLHNVGKSSPKRDAYVRLSGKCGCRS